MKVNPKRILLFVLVAGLFCQVGFAQSTNMTERLKFWLLNNEARALSSISFDRQIISNFNDVFSFSPGADVQPIEATSKLWSTHRKIYFLLDEVQHCFTIATRFGNGRLAVAVRKARPEIWSVAAFNYAFPGLYSVMAQNLRIVFYSDLLKTLELEPKFDRNLAARIRKAKNKLSDEEFRLFNSYIEAFSALFPGDRSAQMISLFLQESERERFAPGVTQLLKPEMLSVYGSAPPGESPETKSETHLAELEKLTEMTEILGESEKQIGSEGEQLQPDILEPSEPGVENLFNIWE
jgi:hypothetical protein